MCRRHVVCRVHACASRMCCSARRCCSSSSNEKGMYTRNATAADAARSSWSRRGDDERAAVTPPEELHMPKPCADAGPVDTDADVATLPGDMYGIAHTRCTFHRPIARRPHTGVLGELMPPGTPPLQCVNARTLRALCGHLGVTVNAAMAAMRETACDVNAATRLLVQRKRQQLLQQQQQQEHDGKKEDEEDEERWRRQCGDDVSASCNDHRAYGLVCLEAYAPETFCIVSYTLPSFAATRDDDVLDVLHELTLSAAELPLDTPTDALVQRFVREWTTNDDTPCSALLDEYDVGVREVVLLPYGEYAVQGFSVLHPVSPTTPNIGTAAAACCFDLTTGIHNRFRFHVERAADSLSEHVLREQVHFSQDVHVLRQPYWFRPEYSVEDYIRYRERVLRPSAAVDELRYAAVFAAPYDLPGYRNRVALEQLLQLQQRYEKISTEFASAGSYFAGDSTTPQPVASACGPMTHGATLFRDSNNSHATKANYETLSRPMRDMELRGAPPQGERVFAPFYRNQYF